MRFSLSTLLLALASAVVLGGCSNYLAPFETDEPHPGVETETQSHLEDLPSPQEQVVAAVYNFRDQTGQYKEVETGTSWSTAVTQGGTSILMRALETSGWFRPIEREGLSNLSNERQIIQSMRQMHEGEDGQVLPPLTFAGVMLEGGIIGYDHNVMTGGAGARYLGIGGSGEFRQDQVTVYLRAVSTQSGEVLKTVHTTKNILSQQVDVGLFRFVDPDRIVEAEAGYTFNEPRVQAVTAAIEEAVRGLIVEGVEDGLWSLEDPDDVNSAAFQQHDRALARARQLDDFGRFAREENRQGLGVGTSVSGIQYQGDYHNPEIRPGSQLTFRGMASERFGWSFTGGVGELGADNAFRHRHVTTDAQLQYYPMPERTVTPVLTAGAGMLWQDNETSALVMGESLFPYATAGGGVEVMLGPNVALHTTLRNHYALVDGLDGQTLGGVHDSFWSLDLGFTFYTSLFR